MQQSNEWTSKAKRVLARKHRPHFAPRHEVLEIYRSQLEAARNKFDELTVLVLGATPELADIALSYGCRLYRVDSNQTMFEAAKVRQQHSDRSNETIICSDWLNMDAIADDTVDFVMGDAAVNQIPHARMINLFSELRRIIHVGSTLVFKQIVMPDIKINEFDFNNAVRAYRLDKLTSTEFYTILRFYCFLEEAYDSDTHSQDAEKVFSAIKMKYETGELNLDEFEFLYARRGKLRHTIYTKTEQQQLFQTYIGACKLEYPKRNFIYENIYNMYVISAVSGR